MSARDEVLELLKYDVRVAKAKYETAKAEALDLLDDGIPTGMPHPNGTFRIRQLLRNESSAWKAWVQARERLDQFAIFGILRDDSKRG
jgi:hypothetical protein